MTIYIYKYIFYTSLQLKVSSLRILDILAEGIKLKDSRYSRYSSELEKDFIYFLQLNWSSLRNICCLLFDELIIQSIF